MSIVLIADLPRICGKTQFTPLYEKQIINQEFTVIKVYHLNF